MKSNFYAFLLFILFSSKLSYSQVAASISNSTNVNCAGGSDGSATATGLAGTPPYTYSWSPGGMTTATVTGLAPGNYTVTVTDAVSAFATAVATINQPSLLVVSAGPDGTICQGGFYNLSASASGGTPGYTYNWSPGIGLSSTTVASPTASPSSTTSYTLTVTDMNGCVSTDVVNINVSTIILTPISTNVTCFGNNNGSASVSITGGIPPYNYSWSNGSQDSTITNLSSGNYSAQVMDANSCFDSVYVTITSPTFISNSLTPSTPSCGLNNGSITANTSGGIPPYSYLWSTGSTASSISNLNTGIYMVDVIDMNGCLRNTVISLGTSGGPTISLNSLNNTSCRNSNDGSISVSVSGGVTPYNIKWSDMAPSFNSLTRTNLQIGPYELLVTDANGCASVFNASISEPTQINTSFTYSNPTSCISGDGSINTATTGGVGGYSYTWSNGATTSNITNLIAGAYTLTVTDANLCSHTSVAYLNDITSLSAFGTAIPTNCGTANGSIDLSPINGSGNYSFLWSNGQTTEDINFAYPGNYGVTITDVTSGCSAAMQFTINSSTANYAPQVCMVTVDSLDEKNVIIWERPAIGGIKEFVIYRETSLQGLYRYIGTNPIENLTEMKDTVADADLHAWKYKISAIDSCGIETGVSLVEHRPIYLTVDTNNIGLPVLTWTHYMGRPYSNYIVKRKVNGSSWIDVVTLPSSQTTFEDLNCPSGLIEYTVEALFTSTCEATRGAINTTRSNIKTPNSLIVGLKGNTSNSNNISLFPNPSQDNFTVSLANKVNEKVSVDVVNSLGQIIFTSSINEGNKSTTIAASNWNTGVYFVRINSEEIHSVIKFVKQ